MPSEEQLRRDIRRRRVLENAEGRIHQISKVPRSARPKKGVTLENVQGTLNSQPRSVYDRLTSTTGLRYYEEELYELEDTEDEYEIINRQTALSDDPPRVTRLQFWHRYLLCLLGVLIRVSGIVHTSVFTYFDVDVYFLNMHKIFFPFLFLELAFVSIGGQNVRSSRAMCFTLVRRSDNRYIRAMVRSCIFAYICLKDLLFYFGAFLLPDLLQCCWLSLLKRYAASILANNEPAAEEAQ